MSKLLAFPMLSIVVFLYNVVILGFNARLEAPFIQTALPSGAAFRMSVGEALISLGLVLLYVEIFKATRTSAASIMDHVLSLVVFVVALIQFLVLERAGTAVYFVILVMTLLDVVAGFTVTITAARRDWGGERH